MEPQEGSNQGVVQNGQAPNVGIQSEIGQTQLQPSVATSGVPSKPGRKTPWGLIGVFIGALAVVSLGAWFAFAFFFKTTPKQETVELVWWGTDLEPAALAPILSEYEAKYNVKITYVKQDKQDYRDRLSSSLEKGSGPDIFEIHNSWTQMFSGSLATLPSQVLEKKAYQDTFYPVVSRDLAQGSSFVGIPLSFDGLALFTNSSIFDVANKVPPTDWNQLKADASEFTKKDKDGRITQSGAALGSTANVDRWEDILSLMFLQSGIDPATPGGPQTLNVLTSFLSYGGEDGYWDETLPGALAAFSKGQVAMYLGSIQDAGKIVKANPTFHFKVSPVPQLPQTTASSRVINFASYPVYSVGQKSKHQKEAWEFLKFISSSSVLPILATNQTAAGGDAFLPSRVDLAVNWASDPILGAYSQEAPTAYSSILSSKTNDGVTGVNTETSGAYKIALDGVREDNSVDVVLETLATTLKKILLQYANKRK